MRHLILPLIVIIAVSAAALYPSNPLTTRAQTYARSVATASAATYVTLRTLNAFLSTIQEVEVGGGAVVVQGSAQPFKAVEPVDDTVERVAQLVFFLMVATGVIAVAMGPASAVGYVMIAGAALLSLLVRADLARDLARRLGWYGVFLALAVPASFLLSSLVADQMTETVLAEHSAVIDRLVAEVEPGIEPQADEGVIAWFQGARDSAERYRALALNVYENADELIASLIAILSVYLFKLLILPGLILGGFFVGVRFFAHRVPN